MRENLSAPGTVVEWLQISKQALNNLNYHNISQDAQYARLSARYGYDDYIIVNIRSKSEDRVLLEFEVSSPKMVQQFKTASAQIVRQMQNEYKQRQEEKKYGPTPTATPYPAPSKEVPSAPHYEETTSDFTAPAYTAEEGDYIERTRILPDETLTLKKYHEGIDRYETEKFKHKFEFWFNRLWVIWLALFLVPPLGIFLIWYFHRMKFFTRLLVTILFFLYTVLIWIGFFGIDTGFNREAIQRFYQNQQYRITRLFNQTDTVTPGSTTDGTDYYEQYDTYTPNPNNNTSDVITEEPRENIFDLIGQFFNQYFGGSGDQTTPQLLMGKANLSSPHFLVLNRNNLRSPDREGLLL